MEKDFNRKQFYGSTTLGEKGQVVIPAEARKTMNLGKGEKLLVFGLGGEILVLAKLSKVEQLATHLAKKLQTIRKALQRT